MAITNTINPETWNSTPMSVLLDILWLNSFLPLPFLRGCIWWDIVHIRDIYPLSPYSSMLTEAELQLKRHHHHKNLGRFRVYLTFHLRVHPFHAVTLQRVSLLKSAITKINYSVILSVVFALFLNATFFQPHPKCC